MPKSKAVWISAVTIQTLIVCVFQVAVGRIPATVDTSDKGDSIHTHSSGRSRTVANHWKKVELSLFSFDLPPGMRRSKVRAIDSAIWRYVKRDMELTIDLGPYSQKPGIYETEPEYREESIEIDGVKSVVCSFRSKDPNLRNRPYVAAVYFSGIGTKGTRLSFLVSSDSNQGQETAKRIFLSIRFEKPAKS